MQRFMKKEDKSRTKKLLKLQYLFRQLCCLRRIGLRFATVLYHPSDRLGLASIAFCANYFIFLSGVFVVLSCRRYPFRYDSCAQIEICIAAV